MKTFTLALSVLAVLLASVSAACVAGLWVAERARTAEQEAMLRAQMEQMAAQQRKEIEETGARFTREQAQYRKELNELLAQNAELSNRIAALDDERTTRTTRAITRRIDRELVDLFGQREAFPLKGRAWGPEQATGEPDTHTAGDQQTAWASLTQDGQEEWLQLEYDQPYTITKVRVYETYNPGALTHITMLDDAGKESEIWRGKDLTPRDVPMGITEVTLPLPVSAKRIRIYLDSVNVPGWNEIDAVGVVDDKDAVHWAVKATASTSFADPQIVLQPALPVNPPKPPEDGQF